MKKLNSMEITGSLKVVNFVYQLVVELEVDTRSLT